MERGFAVREALRWWLLAAAGAWYGAIVARGIGEWL